MYRVLFVDDDPVNAEIAEAYLDEGEFAMQSASSGAEALELLQRDRAFDVLLLDRMMPGMNGDDLLRRLKSDAAVSELPVIFQSSACQPEHIASGLALGARYYLTRPYNRTVLLAVLRAALRDRERQSALAHQVDNTRSSLPLLRRAEFALRRPEDARSLSALLGGAFPAVPNAALGLHELMLNAIEHGNLELDFEEKSERLRAGDWDQEVARRLAAEPWRDRSARVTFTRSAEELCVRIRDEGVGFDVERFLVLTPERAAAPNGRGIVLAQGVGFSSVTYSEGGRAVELRSPVALA